MDFEGVRGHGVSECGAFVYSARYKFEGSGVVYGAGLRCTAYGVGCRIGVWGVRFWVSKKMFGAEFRARAPDYSPQTTTRPNHVPVAACCASTHQGQKKE